MNQGMLCIKAVWCLVWSLLPFFGRFKTLAMFNRRHKDYETIGLQQKLSIKKFKALNPNSQQYSIQTK